MEKTYCCARATTTAYERYGTTTTRVTHEYVYIDGYGTCTAGGSTTAPSKYPVPASNTKRLFKAGTRGISKIYLCPFCYTNRYPIEQFFVTKSEAYGYILARKLCED